MFHFPFSISYSVVSFPLCQYPHRKPKLIVRTIVSYGQEVLTTGLRPLEAIVQASEVLTNIKRTLPPSFNTKKQSNQIAFKNTKMKWPLRDSNPGLLDSKASTLTTTLSCAFFYHLVEKVNENINTCLKNYCFYMFLRHQKKIRHFFEFLNRNCFLVRIRIGIDIAFRSTALIFNSYIQGDWPVKKSILARGLKFEI